MKTAAKILLGNNYGKVLVLQRSSTHPLYSLHLDFPGGLVDHDEDVSQAAVRELYEETSLVIQPKDLTKIMEIINGDTLHVLFTGQLDSENPTITLSWEHASYQWMSIDELLTQKYPDGVDSYYKDAIEHIRKMYNKK